MKNNTKGITLVALVITIIILLILATISIQSLTKTGLFAKAKEAQEKTEASEVNQAKTLNEYEDELNKYITGNIETPIKNVVTVEQGSTTHTPGEIPYSWADLATIAQLISNNTDITNDTAEVTVTLNGTTKTLGIGDTTAVDEKTVRILGFNHDPLTDNNAYGIVTTTGKAGISFEYVDFITSNSQMNTSGNSTNGWAAMPLRTTLNGTVYESLSIKSYIKAVNKEYITTYSTGVKSTCSDKLWLLSCGEIWNNGVNEGNTRGYAAATEGIQYKYYKTTLGSMSWNDNTNVTKKPNISSPYWWWLRSPYYGNIYNFCYVYSNGNCSGGHAGTYGGVAPGFSI